jgi:hypothetical protein
MEVEENHNFVANGIVVHNCDKDDHMMENLYRICLLNTKWSDMEDDYEANVAGVYDDRDAMTGY